MWKKMIPLLMFLLILGACGDEDEVQNPAQSDDTSQETADETTDDAAATDSTDEDATGYTFTEFNLEVDVNGIDDAIDVDYEEEPNDIEASYEDQQQQIQLVGAEALEELDSIFSGFHFDENTSKEEVLEEVRKAFEVPEDADNVELEITFTDGTEIEYND